MIYLCNHIYFYTDISLFFINCIVKILKLSYTQSKLMIKNNVYKVYSDRAMYIYPVRVTNFNRFFIFLILTRVFLITSIIILFGQNL